MSDICLLIQLIKKHCVLKTKVITHLRQNESTHWSCAAGYWKRAGNASLGIIARLRRVNCDLHATQTSSFLPIMTALLIDYCSRYFIAGVSDGWLNEARNNIFEVKITIKTIWLSWRTVTAVEPTVSCRQTVRYLICMSGFIGLYLFVENVL